MTKKILAVFVAAFLLVQPVLAGGIFNDGTLNWGCIHVYDNACDADCNLCGDKRQVKGHVYEATVVAPTCTQAGYTTYVCENCGDTYTIKAAATGHTYKTTVEEPRCDREGYDLHTCTVCGYSYQDNFTPARTEHHYMSVDTDATCYEGGYTDHVCMYCGDSYRDNYTDARGHRPVDYPTMWGCQRYTYCEFCGEVLKPATGHIYTDLWEEKSPTCDEDGYRQLGCYDCSAYITEVIPAYGHSYPSDCQEACSTCGATRVPPHQYADPYFDATCDLCGHVREVNALQAGDVNGDGKVNVRDQGLLQQHLNGWEVTISLLAADVNGDGKVNVRDQGLLQQYLNGWDVKLG